jgi:hypothetical protein
MVWDTTKIRRRSLTIVPHQGKKIREKRITWVLEIDGKGILCGIRILKLKLPFSSGPTVNISTRDKINNDAMMSKVKCQDKMLMTTIS